MRVTLTTVSFFTRAAALFITTKLRSRRSFLCCHVSVFILHVVSFYRRKSQRTNQHETKSNKTKLNDLGMSFIFFPTNELKIPKFPAKFVTLRNWGRRWHNYDDVINKLIIKKYRVHVDMCIYVQLDVY